MKVLLASYPESKQVDAVVTALEEAGCPPGRLSLLGSADAGDLRDILGEHPTETAITGALTGTGVGAALGLLGGIALGSVPGIGPILVSGLMASAAGGLVGSFYGALVATRLEEDDEQHFKTDLSKGGVLLMAEVEDSQAEAALRAMEDGGASHTTSVDAEASGHAARAAVMS